MGIAGSGLSNMGLGLLAGCLVLCLGLGVDGIRLRRQDCNAVKSRYNECGRRAFNDYITAFNQGDDGRPDWVARKTCNYLTAGITMGMNLRQVKQTVDHWDGAKCPAVRSYVQRLGLLPEDVTPEVDQD